MRFWPLTEEGVYMLGRVWGAEQLRCWVELGFWANSGCWVKCWIELGCYIKLGARYRWNIG